MAFLKNNVGSSLSDEALLEQFQQSGNVALLGQLYQRYMELVYGVCLKYLKEPEEAKDSTLAIFEELVTKLQKHSVTSFKGWLYQVAKNHCLMRLRSDKKFSKAAVDVTLMQNEEPLHLNGAWEREENFNQLHLCMAQLSEEQRTVVELFYLKEKCYKTIAAETGLDWNRVRSLIQNGRRNLKICMEQQKKVTSL